MSRHALVNDDGFTLVELIIVMGITLLVTATILSFALDFWGSSTSLQNDSTSFIDRNNAGDRLRDALNVASGLIMQNSITDANAMKPDPSDATNTHWLLIHAVPGSVTIGSSGTYTPLFYYQAPATDSSKNIILNGANPYTNEFILYLNGSTKQLLMRSLANTAATGNITNTTCPAASATSTCLADRVIANNVSSVDLRYFSRSGNLIDYTSIVDSVTGAYIGPDFTSVEVVELTIHEKVKATIHGAQDTINQATIRVALRNG
jgi:type II secretory pathway pseudopilin PulG